MNLVNYLIKLYDWKKNKEMYIKISGDKEIKPDKPNRLDSESLFKINSERVELDC